MLYLQLLFSFICNYQLSIHKTEVYWVFMGSIPLLLFYTQSVISTVSLPLTRFAKRVLHTHSFKTHFSLPSVSYNNVPTTHVFNTAKGWTVCFHSGLFLKPVWYPRVLEWPLNGPIYSWQTDSQLWITTWLADGLGHGFSCFVWHVEMKMAPMKVIWLCLVKTYVAFARHFVATHPPPTLPPYRSASGIGYESKNYL